jgi:hypothetical protein
VARGPETNTDMNPEDSHEETGARRNRGQFCFPRGKEN